VASELLRTSTVPFGVSEFVVPLGALVNVRSLDRSVAFYSEVLGLEVRLRDPQVAILAEPREPQSVLVLRSSLRDGEHHGPDALGTRALFWHVSSMALLDALEQRLRERGGLARRVERDANTTVVVGQDPDRQALAFFARRDGSPLQVSELDVVPQLVYGIDI
jgi:catechol 2,3-dioxygenase-like lactoylglutathione lyase family enzyme